MQNLDSYFIEKGLFDRAALELHADRNMARLRMSEKYPHLGIVHYRDDAVFGKGSWTPFAKACRGVVVDFQNKRLLAKPFHKFFNIGESHAPSVRDLEAMDGFHVMEKLDGSMIILVHDEVTDTFITTTKGSMDSEQGAWAMGHIPSSVQDQGLVREHTLMWEMVSYRHQIVIPYHKKGYAEGLYLIGVRHNKSEKLFDPVEVQAFARDYGLRTFKTFFFPSVQAILDDAKALPFTDEGYVLRFRGSDLMVKVKSAEYLRIHRLVGNLSEGNLLDVLIEGKQQDVFDNAGFLPEEYREDVLEQIRGFQREALEFRGHCYSIYAGLLPKEDKKSFALALKSLKTGEKEGFVFRLYDGKDPQLSDIYRVFRKR